MIVADASVGASAILKTEKMPTYTYKCLKCKRIIDVFHSINFTLTECPHCGGQLQKILTPNAGIIFKGTGFYDTDYKKKSGGNGDRKKIEKKTTKKDEVSKTEKQSKGNKHLKRSKK